MNTASALVAALTDHFVNPRDPTSGAVLTEVTAPGSTRRIDLLAVGLWPSRGYTIDAVEIKVDAGDYRREIENPAKADPWWRRSHRFWIAAPSTAVADPARLPPGWGLLVPARNGRRFTTAVPAATRDITIDMPLLAAIVGRLVNVAEQRTQRLLSDARQTDARRHTDALKALREQYAAGSDPGLHRALDTLRAVQRASGLDIDEWSYRDTCTAPEFGAAVRRALEVIRQTRRADELTDLSDLAAGMRRRAEQLTAAADILTRP